MQVLKILYNIDYRGLNKINQEIEYIKDNKVLNRKKSYETFKLLLSKNKKIKNKKEKLLKSIRMVSGQYSELMVINSNGYFVARLILDRFSLALYSSKAEDVARIKDLQQSGKTLIEAVEILATAV